MSFRKKCELLLEDSSPSGRIICTLSNWDGKCFKIPKSRISDSASLPEIHNTGVYFLVGGEQDESSIYVGEAEDLYHRLKQHLSEDTWQEAYVLTRKGNSLNKAHAKYLENVFYKKALTAERYKILNRSVPTKSSITDSDVADMEEYVYYSIMVVELLDCKAFDILKDKKTKIGELHISSVGIKAQAKMFDDEFVVLKGSQSRSQFRKASSDNLRKKWQKLRDDGIIVDDIFVKDYAFSSPSTAAGVVLGRNANGLTEWKDTKDRTIREIIG